MCNRKLGFDIMAFFDLTAVTKWNLGKKEGDARSFLIWAGAIFVLDIIYYPLNAFRGHHKLKSI